MVSHPENHNLKKGFSPTGTQDTDVTIKTLLNIDISEDLFTKCSTV